MKEKEIWTIGHSTHSLEEFVLMLETFQIQLVVDVRSLPGSNRFPQFNKESLELSLPKNNIKYYHLKALGGLRKATKGSHNTAWRVASFRNYADYMETDEFKAAIVDLEALAATQRVAIMCAEAVWWRCHRSMISDYLKNCGWLVNHIMSKTKIEVHPYTEPAKIIDGVLVYGESLPQNSS